MTNPCQMTDSIQTYVALLIITVALGCSHSASDGQPVHQNPIGQANADETNGGEPSSEKTMR